MAKAMDISIKQLMKSLKKDSDVEKFLSSNIMMEEKTDGVKVQVYLKPDASGKGLENWIVSYKGSVLYPEEFLHNTDDESKKSIGSSQFRFVFEKLKDVDTDKLPKGYQWFFEYLIHKPTLMSQYTKLYELILLSYGPSNCKEVNGAMVCDNNDFNYDEKRPYYAKIFGAYVPPIVFKGVLYPAENLMKGLQSEIIKKVITENIELLKTENKKEYLANLTKLFLEAESQFGGKPEGYVVHYDGKLFKFQQEYQLSREERDKVKMMYKDTPENETIYWANVKEIAKNLIKKVGTFKTVEEALKKISKSVKDIQLPEHSKKNAATIKDDIVLTAKLEILQKLAPETGLIIGKIRVMTNAHYDLIQRALKENKFVIIALSVARGKDKTYEIRKSYIEDCFKDYKDRFEVVNTQNGFIPTILNKSIYGLGVKNVYAGTDRVEGYKDQIEKMGKEINVIELKRSDDDISASKVIANIDDEKYFKQNTPKCMWDKYKLIKDNIDNFK